jgi:hypothetical protein
MNRSIREEGVIFSIIHNHTQDNPMTIKGHKCQLDSPSKRYN